MSETTTRSGPDFAELFGRRPEITARAPGRVNLIGEHTDYNGGFVLPIATPQETRVALAARSDDRVRAWSTNVSEADGWIEFRLGHEVRTSAWGDYIAGVTAALGPRRSNTGFDARVESNLPLGGGLSSSASLEVALLRGLNQSWGLGLDPVGIAETAHRAETDFVGAPVGIMDQMAASLADATAALFLDTLTLTYERLHLPRDAALIVIHSGIAHSHASGEYRVRRKECDDAAQRLGVTRLRDVSIAALADLALPPPLDRRVRHVVTENDRVLQAREALREGDAARLGELMNASHDSMRRDFEISTPEVDRLVALAQSERDVWGARLTGGGFGGCIVALARPAGVRDTAQRIASAYNAHAGPRAAVLIPDQHKD